MYVILKISFSISLFFTYYLNRDGPRNCTIRVSQALVEDISTWTCAVYDNDFNADKISVNVTVLHPTNQKMLIDPDDILIEDFPVKIKCQVQGGNPKPFDISAYVGPYQEVSENDLVLDLDEVKDDTWLFVYHPHYLHHGYFFKCVANQSTYHQIRLHVKLRVITSVNNN